LNDIGWHDIYLCVGYASAQINDYAKIADVSKVEKNGTRFFSAPNNTIGVCAFHSKQRILGAIDDGNIEGRIAAIRHKGLKSAGQQMCHYKMFTRVTDLH